MIAAAQSVNAGFIKVNRTFIIRIRCFLAADTMNHEFLLNLPPLHVNILFIKRGASARMEDCGTMKTFRRFMKDERGVVPLEYLHVTILAVAVFVTVLQFAVS